MSTGVILIAVTALLALLIWIFDRWVQADKDLSTFDGPIEPADWQRFELKDGPSQAHGEVCKKIEGDLQNLRGESTRSRTQLMREAMDELGRQGKYDCEFLPVDQQGVKGEWVIAPGADRSRRALYIHGGAFIAGSPLSHRPITTRLSKAANAAVFSLDYRLMPEHSRKAGIEDTRKAYRWILENGPDGASPGRVSVMGGDSAGGNLVLSLAAWIAGNKQPQPGAVFAFSPLVDSTFSSPSMRGNVDTDTLLGPIFRPLMKIPPRMLRRGWVAQNRVHPTNPSVSPIYADLSGLPPVLIQVSESEMLFDDARRYVAKARASGSSVHLQSWPGLLHVWQIFQPDLPEANQAWEELERWLQSFQSAGSPS